VSASAYGAQFPRRASAFAARAVPTPPPAPPVAVDATATTLAADLEEMLARVEKMPSQRPAIMHILSVLDKDASGATDLARAVSMDSVLAARVMRLANSAFYGVSGRVKTLPFAVTIVGFNAVQATAMSSLLADDIPADQWQMACAHAVSAGHIAPRVGAPAPDAFCAGLLADLGRSVLRQLSPGGYSRLTAPIAHAVDLPEAERAWCGRTHQDIAGQVFTAWSFPAGIVDAAAAHHDMPGRDADPLTVAVAAGHEIAARLLGQPASCQLGDMTRGRVTDAELAGMTELLRSHAEELHAALTT
jgi:HD-like signal output (HDOD) protein